MFRFETKVKLPYYFGAARTYIEDRRENPPHNFGEALPNPPERSSISCCPEAVMEQKKNKKRNAYRL